MKSTVSAFNIPLLLLVILLNFASLNGPPLFPLLQSHLQVADIALKSCQAQCRQFVFISQVYHQAIEDPYQISCW
jgi:hypothetical protein